MKKRKPACKKARSAKIQFQRTILSLLAWVASWSAYRSLETFKQSGIGENWSEPSSPSSDLSIRKLWRRSVSSFLISSGNYILSSCRSNFAENGPSFGSKDLVGCGNLRFPKLSICSGSVLLYLVPSRCKYLTMCSFTFLSSFKIFRRFMDPSSRALEMDKSASSSASELIYLS